MSIHHYFQWRKADYFLSTLLANIVAVFSTLYRLELPKFRHTVYISFCLFHQHVSYKHYTCVVDKVGNPNQKRNQYKHRNQMGKSAGKLEGVKYIFCRIPSVVIAAAKKRICLTIAKTNASSTIFRRKKERRRRDTDTNISRRRTSLNTTNM